MRMKDIDEEGLSLDIQHSKNGSKSVLTSIKLCLYEVLFCLFHSSECPAKISNCEKISFVGVDLLQSLQLTSILSVAGDDISLWDSYGFLLDFMQFLRIDFVLSRLDVGRLAICVSGGLIFTNMILLFVLLMFAYYERPFPKWIRKTTSVFFALHCKFLAIPMMITLLKLLIYSYHEKEYQTLAIKLSLGAVSLFSFLFISFVCIIGSSDIRHSACSYVIDSKTTSFIDMKRLQIRLAILCFYVLQGKYQVFYLSILMFLGEGFLGYRYYSLNVYYNPFASKAKVACSMFVSLAGLAMVAGKLTDNAGVFVLVLYVANPLAILGIIWYISDDIQTKPKKSNLKRLSENPRAVKDCLEVEKILRPFLFNKGEENKDLILSTFDRYFESSYLAKDTSFVVWEAYYCLNCLNNERLSRIKISKRMYSQFSFEGDFQAFLCLKRMSLETENCNEDQDFLQFRIRLEENVKKDRILCEKFLALLEVLTEDPPNSTIVSALLEHLGENLPGVNNEYDHLCNHYNTNKELLILYQSFLSEIIRDKDKAHYINQRHGARNIIEERSLDWFDERNCFLIISGDLSSLGIITYANNNAAEIFEESILSIVGKNIDEYIPYPMNMNHNKRLHRFLLFGQDTKIELPRSTFLKNSKGLVIEIYGKIRCLALESYPMFLFLFKAKKKDRDIVLVDNDGNIQEYSENVPQILKAKSKNLHGQNIEEILMIHASWKFKEDISYYVLNGYKIYHHLKMMRTQKLNMYRFYARGAAYVQTCRVNKRSPGCNANAKAARVLLRKRRSAKKIKLSQYANQLILEDSNTNETKLTNQNSAYREKKSILISGKTKRYMKFLVFLFIMLLVASLSVILLDSVYAGEGFDFANAFSSLYKLWNLETSVILISNSAANFRRTQSQAYYNVFKDHIGQFEKFMTNQKEIVNIFEQCNSRDKIYDKHMFYWENNEIKTINLVDFSSKFVKNAYDFFDQKEKDQSYEFIVLNSNSYPMEYLQRLSGDLKMCIAKLQDRYVSVILIILAIAFCVLLLIYGLMGYVSMQIRQYRMLYWELLVNIFSLTYIKLHSSLCFRLEHMHLTDMVNSSQKISRKKKWKIPPLGIKYYIWLPVALLVGMIIIFSTYLFVLRRGTVEAARQRLNSAECMGKLNFYTQKLDYWTRESMLEDISAHNATYLQPFKQPRQNLEEIQSMLKDITKDIQKKNSEYLLGEEFELFYNKIDLDGSSIINGINGQVNGLLMDSYYYTEITENRESNYNRFNSDILKLSELQEQVLCDSVNRSLDLVKEFELRNLLIKLICTIPGLGFVSIYYILFFRKERKLLEDKNTLFKVINNIPIEVEQSKSY